MKKNNEKKSILIQSTTISKKDSEGFKSYNSEEQHTKEEYNPEEKERERERERENEKERILVFSEINDIRVLSFFRGVSFSNFKKSEVVKQLLLNLQNSKIEPSIYWSAELICSGNFLQLWDIIIQFYSKHIQTSNPKLIIYIELRLENFKNIINMYKSDELRARNNEKIRFIFAELICILCFSKKNHNFQNIKIKNEEFVITNITEKLKAPNVSFISSYYKKNDPYSLFIPFNEFVYNLSVKNSLDCCYWLEYILDYENIIKKKKKLNLFSNDENVAKSSFKSGGIEQKDLCLAERRVFKNVDSKLQMDIIWIFWEILLDFSIKKGKLYSKITESAINLFCIKYTHSIKQKRKYLIYFIITLLCMNIVLEKEVIVSQKEEISVILTKIDKIYSQIKNNEITPKTDYLFMNNDKNKNFEKTISKLEKMESFGETFTPRS